MPEIGVTLCFELVLEKLRQKGVFPGSPTGRRKGGFELENSVTCVFSSGCRETGAKEARKGVFGCDPAASGMIVNNFERRELPREDFHGAPGAFQAPESGVRSPL